MGKQNDDLEAAKNARKKKKELAAEKAKQLQKIAQQKIQQEKEKFEE